MSLPQLIMLPGPTNVPPRVYAAMNKPMINHRGAEFHELYPRMLDNAKKAFQTESDLFVLTSSGTGGIECAASNILQPGEKILILSGIPGKHSQGQPPVREGMRTYYLFQREGLLHGNGTILRFAINQVDIARVTYDKDAPNGVAK